MTKPHKSPGLARLENLIQESNQHNKFLEQCLQSFKQSIHQLQAEIQETKHEYGLASADELQTPSAD